MAKRLIQAVMLAAVLCGPAFAQEPAKPASQDGFVPVDGPINASDTMPAPVLVATAYGLIWVVLFGYVWSVRSRLGRVEREMDAVSRRVAGKN